MFCTKHSDHNVVNAALESLSQILQAKPRCLLDILLSPRGILPTVTSASGMSGGWFIGSGLILFHRLYLTE